MGTTQPEILCIGKDATLLKCRCAVLARGGYKAIAATVPEANLQLKSKTFALVIVSECQDSEQKRLFDALPPETRTLVLNGFIFPKEMLVAVEKHLEHRRRRISLVRPSSPADSDMGGSRKLPPAAKARPKAASSGFRARPEHSAFGRDLFLCLLQGGDQPARILRQLFDEWVDTGLDENGQEQPGERRIGKATAACRLLESYVLRHPPKLFLGDGEHAIRLQHRASPLWVLGSRTNPSPHEEKAANVFIQFLGQDWCFEFAKCRECGCRFDMMRSPAQKYQFGIHCPQHQRVQSHKAAIFATKKARHLRHARLVLLGVQAIQRHDGAWPSSKQLLERINQRDSESAKRLGMTASWLTRHRKLLETLAKTTLPPVDFKPGPA